MHCERQEWEQGDLFRRKNMLIQMHLAWLWLVGYDADRSGRIQHVFGNGVDTRKGSEVKETDETRTTYTLKVKYRVDFFLMWKSLFWQISIVFLKIDLKVKKKKKAAGKSTFPWDDENGENRHGKRNQEMDFPGSSHGFNPWSGKILHAVEHNRWTCAQSLGAATTEALCRSYKACVQPEKPRQWEVSAPQLEKSPLSLQLKKTLTAMKAQHNQK